MAFYSTTYLQVLEISRSVIRLDLQVQASLPSLALSSARQGQALAARILPLLSKKKEISISALKTLSEHTKSSRDKNSSIKNQKIDSFDYKNLIFPLIFFQFFKKSQFFLFLCRLQRKRACVSALLRADGSLFYYV